MIRRNFLQAMIAAIAAPLAPVAIANAKSVPYPEPGEWWKVDGSGAEILGSCPSAFDLLTWGAIDVGLEHPIAFGLSAVGDDVVAHVKNPNVEPITLTSILRLQRLGGGEGRGVHEVRGEFIFEGPAHASHHLSTTACLVLPESPDVLFRDGLREVARSSHWTLVA